MTHACTLSRVQLFATPGTVAHQLPLSMEFSRQEYWNRLPLATPGALPDSGIEPTFLTSAALAGSFSNSATWKASPDGLLHDTQRLTWQRAGAT